MELSRVDIPSPVGPLVGVGRDGSLCALGFADAWPSIRRGLEQRFGRVVIRQDPDLEAPVTRVLEYFAGDLDALEDIPVDLGGTRFQRRVWSRLREIRAGNIISYGELSARLGAPGAARAVGTANGANPVALVIPCHRVIRANGELGGYAYGLDRKHWLLEHEGAKG